VLNYNILQNNNLLVYRFDICFYINMYTNIGLPSYLLYLHWYLIILVLTKLSKNIMFELKYKLLKLYDILFCIMSDRVLPQT